MKTSSPILLDGILDEPAWREAVPVKLGLITDGGEPQEKTEARLIWDDDNLYIAFICQDGDLVSAYADHDQPLYQGDVVEIFLEMNQDPLAYAELEINPRNARFDGLVLADRVKADRKLILAYNPKSFRSHCRIENDSSEQNPAGNWTTEVAIGFRDLGMNSSPGVASKIKLNLYRLNKGKKGNEVSAWFPTGGGCHKPECFREIVLAEKANGLIAFSSYVCPGSTASALYDGKDLTAQGNVPRLAWWPHRGTAEWVEYRFDSQRTVSSIQVCWFDDAPNGACRAPESWQILYCKEGRWEKIEKREMSAIGNLHTLCFAPVTTNALRLSAKLKAGYSGGIVEWRIEP